MNDLDLQWENACEITRKTIVVSEEDLMEVKRNLMDKLNPVIMEHGLSPHLHDYTCKALFWGKAVTFRLDR